MSEQAPLGDRHGVCDASAQLKGSADRLVQRVSEVQAMVVELNDAERELPDAFGSSSNGGPPLDSTPALPASSAPPSITLDQSLRIVEASNASERM